MVTTIHNGSIIYDKVVPPELVSLTNNVEDVCKFYNISLSEISSSINKVDKQLWFKLFMFDSLYYNLEEIYKINNNSIDIDIIKINNYIYLLKHDNKYIAIRV